MISVVMPTYNGSDYIAQAIESIRRQTYRDFEMLIVDDGSTDNTAEIALAHATQDKRIRVIFGNHAGDAVARNTGCHEARYPWVAVMDQDDVALPTRLEEQLKAVTANRRIAALGTAVYHMAARGKVLSVMRHGPASEAEFHERRRTGEDINLTHPTALFKKEVWAAVGGYQSHQGAQSCEDFDLFDRMAESGPILALTKPLLCYRVHLGSISMQRFFTQRRSMRYINARNKARVSGEPPMSFEEFVAAWERQPMATRLRRQAEDLSSYHYRKGGLHYGEGNYLRSLFHLSLSTILRPEYALPRLWKQRMSVESRQHLTRLTDQ